MASGYPPFRADHIGSLLRPPALREAFRRRAAGEITENELRAAQDQAIRDVVRLQEDCGLQVITDGEFRRVSYWEKFVRLVDGLSVKTALFTFHDESGREASFTAPYAHAKVRRRGPITADEYAFLAGVTSRTVKITMPSPSTMHFYRFSDWADAAAYRDATEFFTDLGAIYRKEIADLSAAGCRYVQLDEVAIAILCDSAARRRLAAAGADPDALVDLYIDAINEALRTKPPTMSVGLHLCRGNYKGMYLSEGGYESVAARLFRRAAVSHFLLEFDTPRAGSFEPLRLVPEDKGVVLGLVSSKTPKLEAPEYLKRRVEEAARYIDRDRLALSPQCGFASTIGGNPLTEADERAKLRLCVETAEAIWS